MNKTNPFLHQERVWTQECPKCEELSLQCVAVGGGSFFSSHRKRVVEYLDVRMRCSCCEFEASSLC